MLEQMWLVPYLSALIYSVLKNHPVFTKTNLHLSLLLWLIRFMSNACFPPVFIHVYDFVDSFNLKNYKMLDLSLPFK